MDKHFAATIELGKILDAELSPRNIIVYFHHGDRSNKNVGEITAYYEKELHKTINWRKSMSRSLTINAGLFC